MRSPVLVFPTNNHPIIPYPDFHVMSTGMRTPAVPKSIIRLPREFYMRPTLTVARELIGKYFVRFMRRQVLIGRIVETEAYLGERDPASHAYRGKTRRNEVMFKMGGHLYVYFTYGMHFCCNVVTEREGLGRAVLLRAVEPVAGIEIMLRRRRIREGERNALLNLSSGPARLCEAYGISKKENGTDLCEDDIWVGTTPHNGERPSIKKTTRVGISQAKEHRWRFLDAESPYVSNGRPS